MKYHVTGRRKDCGDDESTTLTIPDCKTKDEAWLAFCREVLPDTLTEQEIREVSVGDNKNYVIHQVSIIADPSDELLAALKEIYEWTAYKNTPWAVKAADVIKRAEEALNA